MKIIDFRGWKFEHCPHTISEVICVKCGKRFIAVRPQGMWLKDLECENCGKGYVIETGENLEYEYGENL